MCGGGRDSRGSLAADPRSHRSSHRRSEAGWPACSGAELGGRVRRSGGRVASACSQRPSAAADTALYSGTMPVDIECPRRVFTADEFERMDTAGVFGPEERLELIDGEIVEMAPVGPGHGAAIACLNKRLILGVGDRAVVWIQGGARIALRSLPRPDLALLRPRSYRTANPTPEDILLVIEVADSSLRYDRIRKQRLYASAGIQQYWVANFKG